MKGVIFRTKH